MSEALMQIAEKLKRADEVIAQLESEIRQFLDDGPGAQLVDYETDGADGCLQAVS